MMQTNNNDRWSSLSMQERAQLLGIYASKGYTDLASIISHYNTFQAGGRLTFEQWKSQMQSKYPDIEMDNTKAGYDYNRYFNDNYDDAIRQLSELRHFPDTYKLPNHKTFSNESVYSRGPMMGGRWVNDSTFSPSIINRQQYPDIYKEDRPYTEREIYGNEYQQGGHLYQDGGPDDDRSYVSSQASETGWLPEVAISATRPDWQRGLTEYDWSRARQYYSNPDGTLTSQGFEFLKNEASKRRTGQSNFMRDVNRLSYIPNAAMGTAGAFSGALVNPYLWSAIGLASGAQNIEDKNYSAAALDIGLTLGAPAVKAVNTAIESTKLGKTLRTVNELRKGVNSAKLQAKVTENPAHTRVKVGDVELGDPSTAYRQGSNVMVDDFLQTGAVRSDGLGVTAKPREEGKIFLGKNFPNPMFKQGNLWYGLPEEGSSRIGLLTTREPLQVATKSSLPNRAFSNIAGTTNVQTFGLDAGRRIPLTETQLNLDNTTAYLYEPNYGYRRVQEHIPTLKQAYQGAMNAKVQGSSIYKSSPEEIQKTNDFLTKIFLGQVVDPSTSFKMPNYLYQSGVDYIERGISPEVRNIVETQVKPRLLTEDTRFKLAEWNPSYAIEFNDAINETVKSTEVSEWSKRMMEDYNRVNNVSWGGFSQNNKPRIIIGKNSNMPVSTTETHELRHQLQKSVPRTPTEYDVLKEAYGDVPQPRKGDGSIDASYDMSQEWETMNTEARKILLEKAGYKYDATKSLEENVIEQDRILENYKNSDLVQILHDNADRYWGRFIDEFQSKSTEEKRAKVAAWKKAMQLVGASTGIVGTGALNQNQ